MKLPPKPRQCEVCKQWVSPIGGTLYRGQLVKCFECKKPALSLLDVKVLNELVRA